ncbi:MAG: hypothetical protein V4543_02835 [Bacteroidota bacterium]
MHQRDKVNTAIKYSLFFIMMGTIVLFLADQQTIAFGTMGFAGFLVLLMFYINLVPIIKWAIRLKRGKQDH